MPDNTSRWLTPQDLAKMTGFSVSYIRSEIKHGALPATLACSPSRSRQRGRWRIAWADAVAYCTRLGFLGGAIPATPVIAAAVD